MTRYRNHLPQLDGGLFLNDAGLETDLIFNHGIEIPEFAAHTLLPEASGRAALTRYMEGFLTWCRPPSVRWAISSGSYGIGRA